MQKLVTSPPRLASTRRRIRPQRCVIVGALVFAIIALLFTHHVTLAAGPATAPGVLLPADEQTPTTLSTPELIDQAYTQGEISAAERLLYLAAALYAPDVLPPQFQSDVPWHGTAAVAELDSALATMTTNVASAATDSAPASATAVSMAEFQRIMDIAAATVCREQDGARASESANFHLSYTSIGGGLSAQSYLDALETTYDVEVSSYGWAKPPYCQHGVGSCTASNPWDKYPVQAVALGGGLYGYVTSGGGLYTGNMGDNPNTAAIESGAVASCMVLNNDFTGFPGGAQISLNATAAHEFVHSIQYGYGDPRPFEDDMWYESSAAYMEDDVFDAANDNYAYLWPTFNACLGEYSGGVYSNWLFFRYAAEQNGGANVAGGGEDVMQQYWVNVSAGQQGISAYDNALATKGANLKDTFHDYAIASRFMKACPAATPYCYEEASGYVASAGPLADHGSINGIGDSHTGSLRNNYAINWVSLPTSGPYAVKMENTSNGGQFRVSIVADTGDALQVTAFPDVVNGNQTTTLPTYTPPNGAQKVVAVITNQQTTGDDPNSCTANPYRLHLTTPETPVINYRTFVPLSFSPSPLSSSTFLAIEDTMILEGYPAVNFCGTTIMWAGYDDSLALDGEIARSLIKFDLSSVPPETSIVSASVFARHVASWDFPDRSRTITAYAVDSAWEACATTWDNQPGIGAGFGSQSIPRDYGEWYEFDITALAQAWVNNPTTNNGIWLRGPEFSGPDSSWRSFSTLDSADAPYLTITYYGPRVELVADRPRTPSTGISMMTQLGSNTSSDTCQGEANARQRCLNVASE